MLKSVFKASLTAGSAALLSVAAATAQDTIDTEEASCELSFLEADPIENAEYEPFEFGDMVTELKVRFVNNSNDSCRAHIALESVSGDVRKMRLGNEELEYRFVDETGGLIPSRIDTINSFVFQAPADEMGKPNEVSINLQILDGQVVNPGTYMDEINLYLFREGDQSPQEILNRDIEIVVPSRVELNIAGARSNFAANGLSVDTIDFGELETGEQESVFIQVRANTQVSLTLDSENKGVLKHKQDTVSLKTSVGYRLDLDGENIDLSGGPATISKAVGNNVAGNNFQVDVTIGEVAGKVAGPYEDVITITVSPI
ncbi:MAG: hypothetical protein AAFR21_11425 [Pseudomonadota bacterium]